MNAYHLLHLTLLPQGKTDGNVRSLLGTSINSLLFSYEYKTRSGVGELEIAFCSNFCFSTVVPSLFRPGLAVLESHQKLQ